METRIIKLSLIVFLLLCLFNMPYWYYQLIRLLGTIGFGYIAYLEQKNGKKFWFYLFIICAIILNPFIKVSFEESIFKIVDVVLATCIILSFIPSVSYITRTIFPKLFQIKLLILSVFMAIGLMGASGYYIFQYTKAKQEENKIESVESKCMEIVNNYNKRCPFEINSDIRCDSIRFNTIIPVYYRQIAVFYTLTSYEGITNSTDPRLKLYKYLVDNYSKRRDMNPYTGTLGKFAKDDLNMFLYWVDKYDDRMELYNYLLEEKLLKGSFGDFSKNLLSNNSYNEENNIVASGLESERMDNYISHKYGNLFFKDNYIRWVFIFMDKDKYDIRIISRDNT